MFSRNVEILYDEKHLPGNQRLALVSTMLMVWAAAKMFSPRLKKWHLIWYIFHIRQSCLLHLQKYTKISVKLDLLHGQISVGLAMSRKSHALEKQKKLENNETWQCGRNTCTNSRSLMISVVLKVITKCDCLLQHIRMPSGKRSEKKINAEENRKE